MVLPRQICVEDTGSEVILQIKSSRSLGLFTLYINNLNRLALLKYFTLKLQIQPPIPILLHSQAFSTITPVNMPTRVTKPTAKPRKGMAKRREITLKVLTDRARCRQNLDALLKAGHSLKLPYAG